MNFILFDGTVKEALLPFTYTRPVADIRIGILTIREKWEKYLKRTTSTLTEEYLSAKFPVEEMPENIMINGSFLPTHELVDLVKKLKKNEAIFQGDQVIAYYTAKAHKEVDFSAYNTFNFEGKLIQVCNTWDIFLKNAEAIKADFEVITQGRKSAPISNTNQLIHPENIFLEEGATVEHSILNATDGPIYIGKNAQIWEGSLIRGSFALCDNAIVKMGAKIYGATTVGPYGKVGGEISNSVIFGYSSKGHDGYLGNSVLGEWCNIGADTNNSNLKNDYSKVRLWNYATESFDHTALQFCGLIMGDHSKTAINTMFNTGTVIGVNCNIYSLGFPRNFVPSFSWGGASGFSSYQPKKAFETAKVMMARRGVAFNEVEANILEHIFKVSKKWRKY